MLPTEPFALHHSWPLFDAAARFDDGRVGVAVGAIGGGPVGRWHCDLASGRLDWAPAVFDLFGLPAHVVPIRSNALSFYDEGSRAAMERLRGHALRHHRGFTLDAAIRPADGARMRWMRLIAAPVLTRGRVIAIAGTKQDVSHLYAGR